MGHSFLSDSWFGAVAELREKAGDLQLPDLIKNLQINIEVSGGPDGTIEARMDGGDFKRGFVDGAPTKLKLPFDVAKKMFIDQDQSVGMQAFMSGQIQVEGDMTKIMSMQAAGGPTDAQKKLNEQIQQITD